MTQASNNDAASFLFYCDMSALSREERAAHVELVTRLFGSLVQETRELPDGYAYRFDGEHYSLLADFVSNERLCCPFLSFKLDIAPYAGPVWLHLTADADVKPFLREEIGHFMLALGETTSAGRYPDVTHGSDGTAIAPGDDPASQVGR